jgi:hypothetical protein
VTIGELFIELGFHADTMKLKDFMHAVGELNMKSLATAVGLGTLYEATTKIMGMADETAMSIWQFSQITGITQKQIQQFVDVVEQMGGSAEDAKGSLDRLKKAMLEVQLGQNDAAAQAFTYMGVRIGEKDPFVILKKASEFLKNAPYDETFKRRMIVQAGISESLIPLLKNITDLTKAMDEQRVAMDNQIATMVRFHQINKKLGQEFGLIWIDAASLIEPVVEIIENLATAITHLVDNILGGKKNILAASGTAVEDFYHWLFPFLPKDTMKNFGDWLNPFKKKTWGEAIPFYEDITHLNPHAQLAPAGAGGATITNHVRIEVSGATSPEETGRHVASVLEKTYDNWYREHYGGGR